MNTLKKLFLFLLILSICTSYSQNNFSILHDAKKEKINFKFVNNLVLLPVTLNGEELTFLLDTGVRKSLLFNVKTSEDLSLNQIEKVTIRGLGEGKEFDALNSKNNLLRIGDIVCPNFELLVILEKSFDFSERMGLDIHGIIGSELFRAFTIEVNTTKKKITFNLPNSYTYKKCRKCTSFDLRFNHRKPYIRANITTDTQNFPVKLLIDSGSGDSLWLFKNSIKDYVLPEKHFSDILGTGLNGPIYGVKSKLKSFHIGDFTFKNLIISHPDTTSVKGNNSYYKRNGLIGSEILKRFHIIYDYNNKKISFKKNKNYYNKPFPYNKSGFEIVHYGKVLVKEKVSNITFLGGTSESNGVTKAYSTYTYSFKNAYQISFVKQKSIADKAGIRVGDFITEINGKQAYNFTLQQIVQKLSDEAGKKIRITVNRNQLILNFTLVLEDLI